MGRLGGSDGAILGGVVALKVVAVLLTKVREERVTSGAEKNEVKNMILRGKVGVGE